MAPERSRARTAAVVTHAARAEDKIKAPEKRSRTPAALCTLATYNVNGVNGRLPRLLDWLREKRPDIVCLQELKTDDSKFPIRAIEAAGYGAVWHGQRSHHGVAILSKGETPVEIRRGIPDDAADIQARYLEAEAKGIIVASVYLPNGNPVPSSNYDYKLKWFARLIAYAKALSQSTAPVALAGDLNVIPTDFDIYNPSRWRADAVMQPATRDAFRRLLAQGWTDAARELYPAQRMYTFWVNDKAYQLNKGFRLDFILLNAALRERLVDAGVDSSFRGLEKPSDHTPAWVSLTVPKRLRKSVP